MQAEGGCLCGNVRFKVDGALHFSALCHCPSCRKSAGAPLVGWAMFEQGALTVDRSRLTVHASSEGVERSFCGRCGTTLFFEADYLPGLIDITTESFDAPQDLCPTDQIWTQHETGCVKAMGTMRRHDALPPQA
ncbi:MAG: GFA family protein [Pseudomonadota bacterium]|nr:GFA family protein [Pseudomonadota bacterium]